MNQKSGKNYRLPSEAEWEYAARGGSKSVNTRFSGSNDIDAVAWYNGNCTSKMPVKQKQPNELGIYDMTGNVEEWCEDDYNINYKNTPVDGSAFVSAPRSRTHMHRGGSWLIHKLSGCQISRRRSAARGNENYSSIGLRIALGSNKSE